MSSTITTGRKRQPATQPTAAAFRRGSVVTNALIAALVRM